MIQVLRTFSEAFSTSCDQQTLPAIKIIDGRGCYPSLDWIEAPIVLEDKPCTPST